MNPYNITFAPLLDTFEVVVARNLAAAAPAADEPADLFTAAADTTTPTGPITLPAPAAPAAVQLSLFRPDAREIRDPQRKPTTVRLDPALHDGTLF